MNAQTPTIEATDTGLAKARKKQRIRQILLLSAPILVIIAVLYFYLTGARYESTDNAYTQAGITSISASVSGKVIAIEVMENQHVKQGDILFRIDPDSYEAAVQHASAALAAANEDVLSTRADYQEALSKVSAAEARAAYASTEAKRQRALVSEGIASRQQYDAAATEAKTAEDAIAAARAQVESLRARLANEVSGPVSQQASIRKAQAALRQAEIDLGNTVVKAPQDGIVTRVNQLQVGNYLTPGKPVFTMVGPRFWVQANFKENQLRYMRVGQPVRISIDAFPNYKLKGHVESFSPGTGSSFSILPAENATGNWVKVVQRLPVQIAIDNPPTDLPLGAGLSVDVEVDTGHQRHLFGPDKPPTSPAAAKAGNARS